MPTNLSQAHVGYHIFTQSQFLCLHRELVTPNESAKKKKKKKKK